MSSKFRARGMGSEAAPMSLIDRPGRLRRVTHVENCGIRGKQIDGQRGNDSEKDTCERCTNGK
jgi:hypothetical protein